MHRLALILLLFFSCAHEKDLYAEERVFYLVEINPVVRDRVTEWAMIWADGQGLRVTIFRKIKPFEEIGTVTMWPVILERWGK